MLIEQVNDDVGVPSGLTQTERDAPSQTQTGSLAGRGSRRSRYDAGAEAAPAQRLAPDSGCRSAQSALRAPGEAEA